MNDLHPREKEKKKERKKKKTVSRCRFLRRIFEGLRLGDARTPFRNEIHGGRRRRTARRVSSNFPWDNVASRARRGGRREEKPRAIVIKHRELAKLRCNLAGDVLPRGLARRGPRAASIHTITHTLTRVRGVRVGPRGTRKVLRDIAPAIRPSFWELNFCGFRSPSPLPPRALCPSRSLESVRAKDRDLLTRILRVSPEPLFLSRPPESSR